MIWQAVQRLLQSKAGKMNSKVMGCGPKILVIPFDVVLSDEVMQMSRNLGVDILHSKKVSGGIILSWIPVSETQIPKSSWVIFENFTV